MAKAKIQKSNFTAGELSDELFTRTDIAQYANGARQLLNVLPVVEGGVKARPGTVNLYTMPFEDYPLRIVPFDLGKSPRFLVIFCINKLRVINASTGAMVFESLGTGYASGGMLSIAQQGLSMWIAYSSGTLPIRWLRASDDFATWDFDDFPVDTPPFAELNATPEVDIKPTGKDVGINVFLESYVEPPAGYDPLVDPPLTYPDVWVAGDVGKYVSINGGLVKITSFVDSKKVQGRVLQALTAAVAAIAGSWVLKESVWTDDEGYPTCITHFKQRLVVAATPKRPNHVWFSRIGDERNFQLTTLDADAFEVVPSSSRPNRVVHLGALRDGVVALTTTNEFFISGGGNPLTPTTVTAIEQTSYGADDAVAPIRISNELLFTQRNGLRLRAMSYRYEVDGLIAEDLSALAAHIPLNNGGIKSVCYQQEPDQIVWCVMNNGSLASCTLNRDQQVIAWARHDFEGSAQAYDMCVTSDDTAYLLISRGDALIGAQVFVERLDYNMLLDGALLRTVNSNAVTIPSLSYFKQSSKVGCTYGYRSIGVTASSEVAATLESGVVANAESVYIGMKYPCTVRPLPPELSGAPLTSLTSKVRLHNITLALKNTAGIKVNDELVPLKGVEPFAFANSPVQLFSGYTKVEQRGWDDLHELDVVVGRDDPYPMRILSLIYEMSAND
jgi:hypothetical protein